MKLSQGLRDKLLGISYLALLEKDDTGELREVADPNYQRMPVSQSSGDITFPPMGEAHMVIAYALFDKRVGGTQQGARVAIFPGPPDQEI